jgi:hypothetical protein
VLTISTIRASIATARSAVRLASGDRLQGPFTDRISFPRGTRHGTALEVPREVISDLKKGDILPFRER